MIPQLSEPSPEEKQISQTLCTIIRQRIHENNNWISFADYMQLALYTPQYGYYAGGCHKIGAKGDFITAPTLTPLFGQALTAQIAELLPKTAGNIYEFGAGTGDLACTIIQTLQTQNHAFEYYYIIEVSTELKQRQRALFEQKIPEFADKVIHLNSLPEYFDGIILGNEVLDAMPCERICWQDASHIEQIGVTYSEGKGFSLANRPLTDPVLLQQAEQIEIDIFPYESELHPIQTSFIASLAEKLTRGAMIWIDYGFESKQYYFPERSMGTFIAHYHHHSIHDPFFYPGLCDLTAHINFTQIASIAIDMGLALSGFTSQAYFLLNLGISDLLSSVANPEQVDYIKQSKAVQILLNQHEMGELFKVIGFTKNIDADNWLGFKEGDRCHKL